MVFFLIEVWFRRKWRDKVKQREQGHYVVQRLSTSKENGAQDPQLKSQTLNPLFPRKYLQSGDKIYNLCICRKRHWRSHTDIQGYTTQCIHTLPPAILEILFLALLLQHPMASREFLYKYRRSPLKWDNDTLTQGPSGGLWDLNENVKQGQVLFSCITTKIISQIFLLNILPLQTDKAQNGTPRTFSKSI